ncbi:aspartyl protease family protein 1-like [Senna tora]|uniref:Aspartyl protease family protein 1-like n=1 Tax=Senna tora TaxID=362788 RepID=A0A834SSN6_9FABA|nr:aspartyl protease family protein 1-like [Senna tora]
MASPSSSNRPRSVSLCRLLLFLAFALDSRSSYALRTFQFDMHHRFSDPVKGMLGIDDLPAKGSREYYVAMSHRDRVIRGRGLAGEDRTAVTFAGGNETYRLASLGFLHYANISVGTPSLSFLVALDTGSDLFWLPCNCTSCVHALKSSDNQPSSVSTYTYITLDLNIYDPVSSSTSKNVLCNSTICEQQRKCPSSSSSCPYQVRYLSSGTSSTGTLVEDVLNLITDDDQTKKVDARVTFGCGKVQTGSFLTGAAPNGLFGLGIENISVPSILAKEGLTSNSFSMCFGFDGLGRIRFGDNGSSYQGKTPFNLRAVHPSYNISITQIIVGGKAAEFEFYAIFDSGTSFTYLNDPAYTQITNSFNTMVKGQRYSFDSDVDMPFEYCYEDPSSNQTSIELPSLNLTMKGGDNYYVADPSVVVVIEGVGTIKTVTCLGIVKSDSVNIIGQNFMTGYRIVFDRENMILGWKNSSCYDDEFSNTLDVSTAQSPAVSPALAVNPAATSNQSETLRPQTPNNHSSKIKPFALAFLMVLFPLFSISL